MEKSDFEKMMDAIPKYKKKEIKLKKKRAKENENSTEGQTYYSDDEKIIAIKMRDTFFIFDKESYWIFDKWLWDEENVLSVDREGYLYVRDKKTGWERFVHRYFKEKEIEDLAEELGCETKDVHVHHIDECKSNNCSDNLEVLYKDKHAQRHGHLTWDVYMIHLNK
jgi:hypothetical protein